ncbi:MaoC/PaaZ C-terminal domain-containing protein [Mycolicibacterium parafortuitum]|uniref:Beta-hydroxyacyl-[acyl-carrier- protein] dehydratase subunit [Nocardia brasiliensis ATCC] n=1 Tax=Mycolicibacterium parafortuitum TaxID=39692 RepID=A0A375YB34_MYCPF|nr:MaoC/PaaZ C-terminal domain-containing protein [Mycolicibacterium parafortuitum]ORB31737.1 dehydratase [Mycolicibacterium parafortuitum]SRX78298.1 beta-hydroxyacyl-[acyl-carrier- protein] dehydratase subunit [Nocardia brasiliensis ATCC] [Mycolicibacterium parafortuitum]
MSTAAADIQVGTELPPLVVAPISRTTLALFAGASGDHNPIHVDIDAARAAGFDDVFAHGMLSMAYLGRLVTSWVPQSQLRALSTRFTSITPVLAQPTCTGTVTGIDDVDGEKRATVEVKISLADGTVTLSGEAVVALA